MDSIAGTSDISPAEWQQRATVAEQTIAEIWAFQNEAESFWYSGKTMRRRLNQILLAR